MPVPLQCRHELGAMIRKPATARPADRLLGCGISVLDAVPLRLETSVATRGTLEKSFKMVAEPSVLSSFFRCQRKVCGTVDILLHKQCRALGTRRRTHMQCHVAARI